MKKTNKNNYTIQSYGCNITCPCSCLFCKDLSEKYAQQKGEKTNDNADMSYPVTPGC